MIRGLVLVAALVVAALPAAAQPAAALADTTIVDVTLFDITSSAPDSARVFDLPEGLAIAGADTIRTNLWIAEALMGETVTAAMRHLPPPPLSVELVPNDKEQKTALLTTMATQQLSRAGYQVHLDQAPADSTVRHCEFRYQVVELGVGYPEVGRRLGIWREWVAREMSFTALYTIVETPGGRVLFNDRVRRAYQDRISSDDLADCQSPAYGFTTAEVKESGWQRRIEEVVVFGALAGLVAIYFQNIN
jgi:hypothetical protein